jgi:hypothetical protein
MILTLNATRELNQNMQDSTVDPLNLENVRCGF